MLSKLKTFGLLTDLRVFFSTKKIICFHYRNPFQSIRCFIYNCFCYQIRIRCDMFIGDFH